MLRVEEWSDLLRRILENRGARMDLLKQFQHRVWESKELRLDSRAEEVLRELAYNLDYFEPDERIQGEEPSYYGEERLESEIRAALAKLGSLEPQ